MHSLPATTRVSPMPTRPSSTVIPRQKVMSLSVHVCAVGSERPLCNEVAGDAFIDCIHSSLYRVAKFVEAGGEDGFHGGEIQFAAQDSHKLFAGAGEGADRGAGYGVQSAVGYADAVAEGAREIAIEEEELDDPLGCDAHVPLAVHF